jgi:hypothetical protein
MTKTKRVITTIPAQQKTTSVKSDSSLMSHPEISEKSIAGSAILNINLSISAKNSALNTRLRRKKPRAVKIKRGKMAFALNMKLSSRPSHLRCRNK